MQCNDVVRQLAARTDDQIPAALAEHLARCTACSEWARRASQLDRLWEATRPPDPAPQAWENVWDRIVESLDSSSPIHVEHPGVPAASRNGSRSKVGALLPQPSLASGYRRRPFAAIVLFGLAQAAAVLFVLSIAWQSLSPLQNAQRGKRPAALATSSPSADAASLSIEIEEGTLVMIRTEGEKPEVAVFRSEGPRFGEYWMDDGLLVFNRIESLAPNSVVAMKE